MSTPDFEKVIDDFESRWNRGQAPDIKQFERTRIETGSSLDLLIELISIDLEFRWKNRNPPSDDLGGKPRIEDYVLLLDSLETSSISAALIAEEYRVRKTTGDSVSHTHFLNRFPSVSHLDAALSDVDDQIRTERSVLANRLPSSFDARAPLPYADFELLEHLGTGGMGKVYRAKQKSLDRKVAVKSLLKSRQDDPLAVEQFLLEAKLLGRLDHPNVVGVHGVGRFPAGGFFLAMEFVAGSSLDRFEAELGLNEILVCCRSISDAIRHSHEAGVVHCDLKPSNILLTNDRVPKVADFGLGALVCSEAAEHGETLHGGTGPYLAPERIMMPIAEPSVDIFGIGAILLYLLAGRPPNINGKLETPTLSEFQHREMKEGIANLCLRCLEPNPVDRFANASQLLAEFDRIVG